MNYSLMQIKSIIMNVIGQKEWELCDYDQLEYLIQFVDWLMLGDLPINDETITGLIDDIITTSIHLLNLDLLDCLDKIQDMINGKIQL